MLKSWHSRPQVPTVLANSYWQLPMVLCFVWIIIITTYGIGTTITPFYKWGNWHLEKSSTFSKIIQPKIWQNRNLNVSCYPRCSVVCPESWFRCATPFCVCKRVWWDIYFSPLIWKNMDLLSTSGRRVGGQVSVLDKFNLSGSHPETSRLF